MAVMQHGTHLLYHAQSWSRLLLSRFAQLCSLSTNLDLPPVTSTTYLDGLRGWAALAVFNFHFFFAFTENAAVGYGYDEKHRSFWALPGIRLLYDGNTCVNIFFLISGYVCSAKALKLMGDIALTSDGTQKALVSEKLLNALTGSVFRRWFRLFLPTLCMSLITSIALYMGAFEPLRLLLDKRKVYFPYSHKFSEPQPRQFPTLSGQLSFWAQDMWALGQVFREGPFYPELDNHLWTIQYEFRMSMHLYIILLALSRCKPRIRMMSLMVLSLMYLLCHRWEGPLFLLGAAFAQWDVMRRTSPSSRLPKHEAEPGTTKANINPVPQPWRILRSLGYTLSIYLLSYSTENYKRPSPGYKLINSLIPPVIARKEKFPKLIGILILFYLTATSARQADSPHPSLWHRFLTCKPARFLGKNMFALYLVHGPVLHMVGYGLPHIWWRVFPMETEVGYMLGLSLGWACALVLCLCAAGGFNHVVDSRCVRAVQWLEKRCFIEK